MEKKRDFMGARNDIGVQRSTVGTSVALNNQHGSGAMRPDEKGNHNPGGTKPAPAPEAESPVTK